MKRLLFFIGLMASIIALSSCNLSRDNSPRPKNLKSFSSSVQANRLWSKHLGYGSSQEYLRMRPAVSGDRIFTVDYDGNLVAMTRWTGKILWKIKVGQTITSGASVDAGKLFVATGNGEIVAFTQVHGKRLWQTPVSSEILVSPTAIDGMVFVKSIDGSLTALSQQDGRQLWHFNQPVPPLVLHASSRPVLSHGVVIAGFANGKLVKFNRKTGRPIWIRQIAKPKGTTDIERMVDIDVTPVVFHNKIFVATFHGNMIALSLKTGEVIWKHKLSSYTGMVVDQHRVYLSDAHGYVWAFNDKTGAVLWRQEHLVLRMLTAPALLNHYVVVADNLGYLHFMAKEDGHFVARVRLDRSGVVAPLVVDGNILYIYSRGGKLYAFSLQGLNISRTTVLPVATKSYKQTRAAAVKTYTAPKKVHKTAQKKSFIRHHYKKRHQAAKKQSLKEQHKKSNQLAVVKLKKQKHHTKRIKIAKKKVTHHQIHATQVVLAKKPIKQEDTLAKHHHDNGYYFDFSQAESVS